MRRFATLRVWKKITHEDMTWLHTSDYRKLLAVARAADKLRHKYSDIGEELIAAVDKFNKPVKS